MQTANAAHSLGLIERPRLLALLDDAEARGARAICLVAPAGYGKTVLAEQWARARHPDAAWHYAHEASADVAFVAAELAAALRTRRDSAPALAEVLQGTGAADIGALVRVFADALREQPADPWIVVDDFHFLHDTPAADFVHGLVRARACRILLTSRVRPRLASARETAYGQSWVIGADELRFDPSEVASVGGHAGRSGFDDAEGWPVLVALAAASAPDDEPLRSGPDVFQFVAEHVYGTLDPAARQTLAVLALLPRVDRGAAEVICGPDAVGHVDGAIASGLLTSSDGGRAKLHPLLRAFLLQQFDRLDAPTRHAAARSAFAWALHQRDWDAAYAIASLTRLRSLTDRVLRASCSDLLARGRHATLRRWLEPVRGTSATALLVETELAFADGDASRAARLAQAVIADGSSRPRHIHRAHYLLAILAFVADRFDEADEHYAAAERFARTPERVADARWGRFVTASGALRPNAQSRLAEWEAVAPRTTGTLVRGVSARFNLARTSEMWLEVIERADAIEPLVASAPDPHVRTHFRMSVAERLVNAVRMDRLRDAITATEEALAHDRTPYIDGRLTTVLALEAWLLRRFNRAAALFDEVVEGGGADAEYARMLRVLVPLARGAEAPYELELHELVSQHTALQARSWSALHAAARGDRANAVRWARSATRGECQIYVRHVADLALGIVELHASGQPSSERLAEAARSCVTSEDTFEVVAAYRCCPDILPHLLDDDVVRPRLVEVLNEIDPALASAHGVLHPDASVRAASVEALSTREREVFDLLAEGLTNRQIAQRLFITEATAKLHVRHILAKLGARSRVEAVLLATE